MEKRSTIPSIFHKLQFHPFFFLFLFICTITGHFKFFVLFMALISIHEMGHIIAASFFGWHIEKILILPFGGITIFNEKINCPLKEEFFVAISGVLAQSLFYFLVRTFTSDPLLIEIHYGLLLFNLLPICPLDGSKILSVLLNTCFSFSRSHLFVIFFSLFSLPIFFYFTFHNIFYVGCFLFLGIELIREIKKHPYLFRKFLLERYLYSFPFSKKKKITHIKEMKKDFTHTLIRGKRAYEERDFLRKLFDKDEDL